MVPESIEREILIDAPLEMVWSVVTESQHVGDWFSDFAEIDLRPGGQAILTWEKHGTARGRVERVEPPHFVSFRWMRLTASGTELTEGNSTLVEFSLTEAGEGTRLRVVESGFHKLDGTEDERAKYAEGNRDGWEVKLGELRDYVSKRVRESARG